MGNTVSGESDSVLRTDNVRYGWKRDIPDHRDLYVSFESPKQGNDVVDLREKCPPIYDQGKLGSCTANAIAFAYQFDELKQNEQNDFVPSRLFIYYNEREMEGTTNYDSGAAIRDGIKSINKQGVCTEDMWEYDISKFTEKPDQNCYEYALGHHSLKYQKVNQTLDSIKGALNSGFPIVFGFTVYESFESSETAQSGMVSMPKSDEKVLGGHAVAIVGYNEELMRFIVRNSWSESWGDNGYCYFPYDYITNVNLCSDFWIVQKITNNQ